MYLMRPDPTYPALRVKGRQRQTNRRGVVSIWSMFVFLTMLTLYPDSRITGFALDAKTSGAAKVY